jgi:hypothetical protein
MSLFSTYKSHSCTHERGKRKEDEEEGKEEKALG